MVAKLVGALILVQAIVVVIGWRLHTARRPRSFRSDAKIFDFAERLADRKARGGF